MKRINSLVLCAAALAGGIATLSGGADAAPCDQFLGGISCPPGYTVSTRYDGYTAWGLYMVGEPTSGTWTLEATSDDKIDFCGTCGPATANLTTTASQMDSDAITTSADVTISAEVNTELNLAGMGKMGVKASEAFKLGLTNSSSISDTVTQTVGGTVSAPPPRIAHVKAQIWGLHARTATATFFHNRLYSARCCLNGNCGAWTTGLQCNDGTTAGGTVTSPKACLSRSMKMGTFWDEQCAVQPNCGSGSGSGSGH
jgi:hypothetical protein